LSKSYNINGVPIVEEGDPGDLYLVINIDGIDIKQIFFLYSFSISNICLNGDLTI